MCDGDRIALVDDGCAGPNEGSHNGCVGLSGEYREVADRHFARDGPRYQQEGGRAPVALDFELRRPVALSSGHVEFFIVFMQDFDAEALGRVDRDVDIGGRYYVGHVNRRLLFGDRPGPAAAL